MSSDEPVDVAVVGSVNRDLVVPVERTPRPGETVLGGTCIEHRGGKGANQAVACARLGRRTAFVGCVGQDQAGDWLRQGLVTEGVATHSLDRAETVPSGLALITVAANGDSTIVVSPGANTLVDAELVERASHTVASAAITLTQLEIPLSGVEATCRAAQGLLILNPAPAQPLSDAILSRCDLLVPNRLELFTILGERPAVEPAQIEAAAQRLAERVDCVVTLGSSGALVAAGGHTEHIPALPVDVSDTTAAGDAFCAGVADALLQGADVFEAAKWARVVAAAAVMREGAQPSLPTRAQARSTAGDRQA